MRILYIILGLFILPLLSAAQVTNVWSVMQYTDTAPLAPPATGSKIAYRMLDNTVYYWNGSAWVKIGTGYLQLSDTSAMLDPYISIAGYGLVKSASHTLRADTSLLSTKLYSNRFIVPSGQVAVGTGSGLTGYSELTWNNTTGVLSTSKSLNSSIGYAARNTTNGSNAEATFIGINNLNNYSVYGITSSTYSLNPVIGASRGYIHTDAVNGFTLLSKSITGTIVFATAGNSSGNERMRIAANGSVNIGSPGTPAYVLDINSTNALRLPRGTDAQRPTGAQGILRYNTTGNGVEWYNGTRWAYALESTFARGTSTYVPHFDANGQISEDAEFRYDASKDNLGIGGAPSAALHIQGNRSAASWTTGGLGLRISASTYTNTTSAGTVAEIAAHSMLSPTFAASTPTTYTRSANLRLSVPVSGTNVTQTEPFALLAENAYIGRLVTEYGGSVFLGSQISKTLTKASTAHYTISRTGGASAALYGQSTANGSSAYGVVGDALGSGGSATLLVGVYGEATNVNGGTANGSSAIGLSARVNSAKNDTTSHIIGVQSYVNLTFEGGTGTKINTATAFYGLPITRNNHSAKEINGFYFPGLAIPSSTPIPISNVYRPLRIVAGNTTNVLRTWSLIDHKITIGSQNESSQELDVYGDFLARDTIFNTNPATHATVDGFATWKNTAQGYALGKGTLSSSLKIASGVLDLKHKSLIDSLPIASVSIDAAENDFEIVGLNSLNFEFENFAGTITSDGDVLTVEQDSEINFITGQDSELRLGLDANIQAANTEGVIGLRIGDEDWIWHYVNDDALNDEAMRLTTIGNEAYLTLTDYGLGNITVATVSENPGLNIPVFTPTGKVLEMRITRDTFVEDQTLFSVGTLLYTCDHLFINSSMTGTAPANMELRFPDPGEHFRGKKITVYSGRKDASSFVPQIKVAGGSSRLRYTTDPSVSGSMPSDQSILSLDGSTWSYNGVSYEWTCVKIDNSPAYRWVLNQK